MRTTAATACGRLRGALVSAALLGAPLVADATAYEWTGGPFSTSGVPNPLASGDSAQMHSPRNAAVFDVDFTNRGTFSYRDDNLVLANGVTIVNEGRWVSQDDHGLLRIGNSTAVPRFVNFGTFLKTGGGPTLIVNIDLDNRRTIQTDRGVIALNSLQKTFRSGTVLRGEAEGRIEIRNGGSFLGSFSTANVEFMHGDYRGDAAQLAAESNLAWTAGTFLGSWHNAGLIVARDTGGTRLWGPNVQFTNDATFRWESGEMTVGSGAAIVNDSRYEMAPISGTAFQWIGSGARPTFTNHGTFVQLNSSTATAPLHVGDIHFVNHGTIQSAPGSTSVLNFNGPATFEDGSKFTGNGFVRISHDATFRGAFTSGASSGSGSVLQLRDGRFTGADARIQGSVQWLGGTFVDTWNNDGTLNVLDEPGSDKRIQGVFRNSSEIAWVGGSEAIVLGSTAGATVLENRGRFNVFARPRTTHVLREDFGTQTKFLNSATVQHFGSGTTTIRVPFENFGKVHVNGGRFELTSLVDQRGTFRLADAVLSVSDLVNFGRIEGTGALEGNVENHGYIAPGLSPGTLRIEGGYGHAGDGTLEIELHDLATFDRLLIDGDAELQGGELALHCFAACDYAVGDRIDFLGVGGELTGTFGALTLHGFGTGWRFGLGYDYDADRAWIDVLAVAAPPPGSVDEPAALLLVGLALAGMAAPRRQARAARRLSDSS